MNITANMVLMESLIMGGFQVMGQDSQVSADKLKTSIEEPLSGNGIVKLFIAVERIPGLDK